MFDNSRDFIQAHFYLSPRTDTAFWRANKKLALAPQIQEKIAMYKAGLPIDAPSINVATYRNNDTYFRNFWSNGSYYCVFAGLGVLPDAPLSSLSHRPSVVQDSKRLFEDVKRKQREMTRDLPTMVEYLRRLHHK